LQTAVAALAEEGAEVVAASPSAYNGNDLKKKREGEKKKEIVHFWFPCKFIGAATSPTNL
jgi:hypothetical protein